MATSKRDLEEELLETAFETFESFDGAKCEVQLQRNLTVNCPFDDRTDEYNLTITYLPNDGKCLELESVASFLDEFEDVETSQEAVCQFLAHFIFTFIRPEWIEVEVAGEHYGIHTTTTRRREK